MIYKAFLLIAAGKRLKYTKTLKNSISKRAVRTSRREGLEYMYKLKLVSLTSIFVNFRSFKVDFLNIVNQLLMFYYYSNILEITTANLVVVADEYDIYISAVERLESAPELPSHF